ncbi:MAG: DUF1559 domain-containing protein [Opitutaceae bacterium]|jgi:prepilin-type N-terminal cleavage/methylation domain-containing protein|nr:DUF1559 domain-containing protein [Opitutaceae bacterium]
MKPERAFTPQRRGSAQSKIGNRKSKISRASRAWRGFTLVELLTVIAIIGILAAIIIPTVGKVRKTAKRAVCASNLRQVATACIMYRNDNKGKMPYSPQRDGRFILRANGAPDIFYQLLPYVGLQPLYDNPASMTHPPSIFMCPDFRGNEIPHWDKATAPSGVLLAGYILNQYATRPAGSAEAASDYTDENTPPRRVIAWDINYWWVADQVSAGITSLPAPHDNEGFNAASWAGSVRWIKKAPLVGSQAWIFGTLEQY